MALHTVCQWRTGLSGCNPALLPALPVVVWSPGHVTSVCQLRYVQSRERKMRRVRPPWRREGKPAALLLSLSSLLSPHMHSAHRVAAHPCRSDGTCRRGWQSATQNTTTSNAQSWRAHPTRMLQRLHEVAVATAKAQVDQRETGPVHHDHVQACSHRTPSPCQLREQSRSQQCSLPMPQPTTPAQQHSPQWRGARPIARPLGTRMRMRGTSKGPMQHKRHGRRATGPLSTECLLTLP